MDNTTSNSIKPVMTIGKAVPVYFIALLVLAVGITLTIKVESFTSTILAVIYLLWASRSTA